MVVISAGGLALEGSARAMADLPSQSFGIMLSDGDIEAMIACVQNGGDIQLSLGSSPVCMEALARTQLSAVRRAAHNSAVDGSPPIVSTNWLYKTSHRVFSRSPPDTVNRFRSR